MQQDAPGNGPVFDLVEYEVAALEEMIDTGLVNALGIDADRGVVGGVAQQARRGDGLADIQGGERRPGLPVEVGNIERLAIGDFQRADPGAQQYLRHQPAHAAAPRDADRHVAQGGLLLTGNPADIAVGALLVEACLVRLGGHDIDDARFRNIGEGLGNNLFHNVSVTVGVNPLREPGRDTNHQRQNSKFDP